MGVMDAANDYLVLPLEPYRVYKQSGFRVRFIEAKHAHSGIFIKFVINRIKYCMYMSEGDIMRLPDGEDRYASSIIYRQGSKNFIKNVLYMTGVTVQYDEY